jgi:hypothetical protein
MFDKIVNHPELFSIVCGSCSENNAHVEFDDALKINGEIDDSKVLILKPDSFYNTKDFATPPKSLDCLILVNCVDKHHYDLYLIELKDVEKLQRLIPEDIVAKFESVINDFFVRFAEIFNTNYGKKAFYVINPHYKKLRGLELEIITSSTPLRLNGEAIPIRTRPSLTIMPC